MYNTKIGQFCAQHEDYIELLSAEPYNIKIKEDGPYIIFNYNQLSSDFSNPIVQEARGIIFRKGSWENPVCWAFNKFGNFGESWVQDIDWSTAFVSEKVDGSLMKVWWDGDWNISTNGTIDAFKADLGDVRMSNFGEYFIDTLLNYYNNSTEFYNTLDEDKTYMFELVGPYNRVVVPYEEPALYFLGARNKHTGEEFNCSPLNAGALSMGRFKLPKHYPFNTLELCIKITENFPWDAEGMVACDAQFNRVKIKSPAYVLAHFARNNNVINRKHLIKVILTNEVEEFLCYAAEYKEELEKTQGLMKSFYKAGDRVAKVCHSIPNIPKRDYAALVQILPKIFWDFAFRNYDKVIDIRDYTSTWNELKWDTYLKDFEEIRQEYFL